MCYSAQVHAEFSKFRRETGADMDLDSYIRIYWWHEGKDPRREKVPRAEIDRLLAEFEERLPVLLKDVKEWELAETFAGEADHILCMARAEDYDGVCDHLQAVADRQGIGDPTD